MEKFNAMLGIHACVELGIRCFVFDLPSESLRLEQIDPKFDYIIYNVITVN